MAWVCLLLAGLCEMTGVIMMNRLHRDGSLTSWLLLIASFGASFGFLSIAMETLPMGTAYAVWTGIGASGGAIVGMLLYGEPRSGLRLFFISLVLASAVGLKLVA